MSSTRGIRARYNTGDPIDPNDLVGPEVTVTKAGYGTWIWYYSNSEWRMYGEDNSPEFPFVIDLTRTHTEQARCSEPGDGVLVYNRGSMAPGR
ncbi:MAG: hypothetical protein NT167_26105 [Verrucomicrobia bacterium]|nr:hypothetical protein [Verrucomicrobiota bacterium]